MGLATNQNAAVGKSVSLGGRAKMTKLPRWGSHTNYRTGMIFSLYILYVNIAARSVLELNVHVIREMPLLYSEKEVFNGFHGIP